MVVKIVHDSLVETLGTESQAIDLNAPAPVAIMLVGLQGAGKTTTAAKIAKRLTERDKRKVLMASLDVKRPTEAFFGPMVVLQNERSASDAEMFPDGFRSLGLGKLVGMPTMGAVIGTGSFILLDGSTLRTPGAAVTTARGEDMERFGVIPDFIVDNTPPDFLTQHDRQVEKAIEVLKGEMK